MSREKIDQCPFYSDVNQMFEIDGTLLKLGRKNHKEMNEKECIKIPRSDRYKI
jgi:hypothetical protein